MILVASSMQGRNENHAVRDVKMEEADSDEQKTEKGEMCSECRCDPLLFPGIPWQ